ncbi:MAG: hypothetical protein ABIH86_06655 [Planctomycetota bacterium]
MSDYIRSVQRAIDRRVVIDVPDSLCGIDLEVIVLPANSHSNDSDSIERKNRILSLFGAVDLGLTDEMIDSEIQHMRDEWNRNS